jgi:leucyl/phenylalanyl-tRNA--protein transferase
MVRLRGFPDLLLNPESADDSGLVAIGGDLNPARLLQAYRCGVFPWYDEAGPICWWSPDPRAVIELDGLHVSRRLRRTLRSGRFQVSLNQAFGQVIRGCANRPGDGTWITPGMIRAYETLHRLGHAHSVETWQDGVLAGGIYGVVVGGLFAGESMFYRRADGSKVALAWLVEHLQLKGFQMFDIQFVTEHTARMGAVEIPRREYLTRLRVAVAQRVTFR